MKLALFPIGIGSTNESRPWRTGSSPSVNNGDVSRRGEVAEIERWPCDARRAVELDTDSRAGIRCAYAIEKRLDDAAHALSL